MSDEKMTAPPPMYAVLYPALVAIARKHGYALGVHGSMARDFDLIAVPWTEEAGQPMPMIDEMKAAVQGVYTDHEFDHLLTDGHVTTKPHGRMAWSIHLTTKGSDGPYLDISVMPLKPWVPLHLRPDWIEAEDRAGGALVAGGSIEDGEEEA